MKSAALEGHDIGNVRCTHGPCALVGGNFLYPHHACRKEGCTGVMHAVHIPSGFSSDSGEKLLLQCDICHKVEF